MKKQLFLFLVSGSMVFGLVTPKSVDMENGNIFWGKILDDGKDVITMKVKKAELRKITIKRVKRISKKNRFYSVKMKSGVTLMGILSKKSKSVYLIKGSPYLMGKVKLNKQKVNQRVQLEKMGIITRKTGLIEEDLFKDEAEDDGFDMVKRFSFFSNYMKTVSTLSEFIPAGYALQLSYDQGLTHLTSWPVMRFELGYEKFDGLLGNTTDSLLGIRVELGPMWIFSLDSRKMHFLSGGFTTGVSYESVLSNGASASGVSISASIMLEYNLQFSRTWGMMMQLRSSYTHDSTLFRLNLSPAFGFVMAF